MDRNCIRKTEYSGRLSGPMFGQRPMSTELPSAQSSDPNELLRRIDQRTTQMFHWIRAGLIVVILLLILIVLIG